MTEPLTPLRWAGRAIGTAVVMLAAGAVVGGVLGVLHPMVGMAGGGLVLFLGGGAWAAQRLSAFAWFGAVMLGVAAAVGSAIEGRKAWVATMSPVAEHALIVDWSPESSERLVHTRPLAYLTETTATVSGRYVSGVSKRGVKRHGR